MPGIVRCTAARRFAKQKWKKSLFGACPSGRDSLFGAACFLLCAKCRCVDRAHFFFDFKMIFSVLRPCTKWTQGQDGNVPPLLRTLFLTGALRHFPVFILPLSVSEPSERPMAICPLSLPLWTSSFLAQAVVFFHFHSDSNGPGPHGEHPKKNIK